MASPIVGKKVPVVEWLEIKLSTKHFRLVIAIQEECNLVRAAKRLNMTQPAATKALQATETHLGVKLFRRTSTGMVPTIYGSALAARARVILSDFSSAAREIVDLRDGTGGRVSIGALLAASSNLLPRAIDSLRRQRPRVTIGVMEATNDILMPALRSGKLDVVVGRLPEFREREGLVQEVLFQDKACIVVRRSHPLVGRHDIRLSELAEAEWILPPPETTLRRQIEKAFRDIDVPPPLPAVEAVSYLMDRSLLLLGNYLAVWPWQLASGETDQIAILPVDLPPTAGPIGISTRAEPALSPAAQMFVDTLRLVTRQIQINPFFAGPRLPLDSLLP